MQKEFFLSLQFTEEMIWRFVYTKEDRTVKMVKDKSNIRYHRLNVKRRRLWGPKEWGNRCIELKNVQQVRTREETDVAKRKTRVTSVLKTGGT